MGGATSALPERLVGAPPRLKVPVDITHNPDTWQWRLARFLIGPQGIEVAPILPARPIYPHETLWVRLGEAGALNTVEVKIPDMAQTNLETTSLLPIEDLHDIYPHTLVCLEVIETVEGLVGGKSTTKVVGFFRGWSHDGRVRTLLYEPRGGGLLAIPAKDVKKAWYAPAGYQP